MKKQDIKAIKLGPRQLALGFENDGLQKENAIMSRIADQIEKNGLVVLNDAVRETAGMLDITEFNVLQHIFHLAHDRKIHFRLNDNNIEPHVAKKKLLASPSQRIEIVPNKSVDAQVFQKVKILVEKISSPHNLIDDEDQYAFSRHLILQLDIWKTRLDSYRDWARQPGFPGLKQIETHRELVSSLSKKLDPYTLIHAFYHHKSALLHMAEDMARITAFNDRHLDFWEEFVESMAAFREISTEILQKPEFASYFDRLEQILSAPGPWGLIDEAESLLGKVSIFHDKIVKIKTDRFREEAGKKVDNMIKQMTEHLKTHHAPPDLRNKSLHLLRAAGKKLGFAKTIEDMKACMEETEDGFDLYWDEIET